MFALIGLLEYTENIGRIIKIYNSLRGAMVKLLLVLLASFVGSGLKAVGGFGFATITTPVVALFWDVPTAIAVISVPTLIMSFLNAWRSREAREGSLKPFYLFFFASLVGLGVGLTFLLKADSRLMKFLLGFFLVSNTLWHELKGEKATPQEITPSRTIGTGLLAGIMLGTVNMPSHVIASYLTSLRLTKATYLFILSSVQVILRTLAVGSLFFAGTYTRQTVWLIAAVTIPVFLGYAVGTRFYKRFPEQLFFRFIQGLLLLIGLLLMFKNRDILAFLG